MKNLIKILLLLPVTMFGQDIHFVQSSVVPQLLNPATVGVFEGWERVSIAHRQQWLSMGSPYVTSQLSADLNVFKESNSSGYLGLGLNFYNDIAGDGKFGTTQFSLSVAGILPVKEAHTISAGIQIGGAQRTGNINSLSWGNQWNGRDGFSSDIASNENNSNTSFMHSDMAAGIFYNYADYNNTLVRKEFQNIYGGVSYFHITRPHLNYRGGTDRLHSKLVILGGGVFEIPRSTVAIAPSASYILQGPLQETLISALLKFRLKNGSKYTGINNETYFSIGGATRINDSFAPNVIIEIGSFKIGLAYEFTTSSLANVAKNSFELTLQWANMKTALFQGRRTKGWKKPSSGI